MKKINIAAFFALAAGVLTLFIISAFFHFYTYNDDGSIHGDWRANESVIYLGTARLVSAVSGIVLALGIAAFFISQDKLARKQNIAGALILALGAIAIIGSLTAFYPCTEMMKMNDRPMRCYWTMKLLLVLAGAISVSGVLMMLLGKSKEFLKGMNSAVIMFGCLFVLAPLKITEGFCSSMTGSHPCLDRFRPFTIMIGFIILAVSVINCFILFKKSAR